MSFVSLGYIPGHIHAFWLIYKKMEAEERYGNQGFLCESTPFICAPILHADFLEQKILEMDNTNLSTPMVRWFMLPTTVLQDLRRYSFAQAHGLIPCFRIIENGGL
jgi:hypothetical protein